jgi:hypothetical protein
MTLTIESPLNACAMRKICRSNVDDKARLTREIVTMKDELSQAKHLLQQFLAGELSTATANAWLRDR